MHRVALAEYSQAAAAALVVGRIVQLKLNRRQPGLLIFLIFNSLSLLILASMSPRSNLYFVWYLVGTMINVVISIAAVRDLFALTFEQYPGIRTAGRRVLYCASGLSVVCAAGVTVYFNGRGEHSASHLFFAEILERSVASSLAIIVVTILVTLSHYPLHLNRNTYVSTLFFSAILLSGAAQLLIDSLDLHLFSEDVDIAAAAFATLCFSGWSLMLTRRESDSPTQPVIAVSPRESELLAELEEFNRLLGGAKQS